jgi:hypothetical protein
MGKKIETTATATGATVHAPTVTMEALEALVCQWANLSSKDARLFSALCGAGENVESAIARMTALIGEFRAMARTGASKAFTFPSGHTFSGMTGRDALNAVTDDRDSNGKVRTAARDRYKIRAK